MSTATRPRQQYLLLEGKSWDEYRAFERIVDRRPGCRLTYDTGRIEFMTLSFLHESLKTLFDRLMFAIVEEFDTPIVSGGSTTFRREDMEKGLEPDQCYYFDNEVLVRGKEEIDLTIDPPPDLAIEIEVSRSILDRLGIFAAIGVPEVWCVDSESVRILRLNDAGEYEPQSESGHFPGVTGEGIANVLKRRKELDERALIKSFREWVQTVHKP